MNVARETATDDDRLRAASADDAQALAELVNFAGEGMPLYLWTKMARDGKSPWDVGRQRAQRQSGAFSYRNAVVLEEGGRVAAALIGYPLPDEPQAIDSDMPPMFVPMQELENLAPGTWYINVIAAVPEYRGRGLGTSLLKAAERLATETKRAGLSLIVADTNVGARRLYERCGFRAAATRPMVKEDWRGAGENWVLMTKAA